MLHITNGDSSVQLIQGAGLAGEILPWQDVLHEGPVPENLQLDALSDVRARYLADCDWGEYRTIREQFRRRDWHLQASGQYEELTLWFEHDLYDQLQILQILDWLGCHGVTGTRITSICIDRHPDVPNFHGLGMLQPYHIPELFASRQTVSAGQLELARRGWLAFRSPDPRSVARLLEADTSALPFLGAALHRYLEEFPAVGTGLSRTQHTSLALLAGGECSPLDLFAAVQDAEPARYLGDWVFWRYLQDMISAAEPLMATATGEPFRYPPGHASGAALRAQRLRITPLGQAVLAGQEDWLQIQGIDRWLGGVHLLPDNLWRWNAAAGRLAIHAAPPTPRSGPV